MEWRDSKLMTPSHAGHDQGKVKEIKIVYFCNQQNIRTHKYTKSTSLLLQNEHI